MEELAISKCCVRVCSVAEGDYAEAFLAVQWKVRKTRPWAVDPTVSEFVSRFEHLCWVTYFQHSVEIQQGGLYVLTLDAGVSAPPNSPRTVD